MRCDPDPACNFDADPDPIFYLDADPDPTFHFDADPDPAPSFQIRAKNIEKVHNTAHNSWGQRCFEHV